MNLPFDIDALTPDEEDQILSAATRVLSREFVFASLEDLLMSPAGFGLDEATELQRALCRVIEGAPLGDLIDHPDVVEALGGMPLPAALNGFQVPEVVIVAAVRTAKSMIAAAVAIWASQHADISKLKEGEIPRYSILSLELDNAKVVLGHLLGALSKPALVNLRVDKKSDDRWRDLIDDVGADVVGSEFLWHPSGRPVEIRVVAGKRAGGSLVSRWSIGATLDEAPRMVGGSDGVINYDDARRAVRSRLLPGAQVLSIGSPWQSYGPIYDYVQNEWGSPHLDRIIVKARGPQMNPYWWNPERCEEIRRSDPVTYQTDVLAEFADAEESLFPNALVLACSRKNKGSLPFMQGHDYVAAMDPATRGNAWTLIVASRRGRKKTVVLAHEWRGTSVTPLAPREVLGEVKELLGRYRLEWAYTDQWAADALRDLALSMGFSLLIRDWNGQERVDAYTSLAAAMADRTVEIPDDTQLQKDLKLVKKRPTDKGISIKLPSTPDGRHCDYAPALARALKEWIEEERDIAPRLGEPGYWPAWEVAQVEQEEAALKQEDSKQWWEPEGIEEWNEDEMFGW